MLTFIKINHLINETKEIPFVLTFMRTGTTQQIQHALCDLKFSDFQSYYRLKLTIKYFYQITISNFYQFSFEGDVQSLKSTRSSSLQKSLTLVSVGIWMHIHFYVFIVFLDSKMRDSCIENNSSTAVLLALDILQTEQIPQD